MHAEKPTQWGSSFRTELFGTFAPESDHRVVRERMNQALHTAFAEYKDNLERQHRQIETSIASISAAELRPKIQMHFDAAGLEVLIRYPVLLQKALEIDTSRAPLGLLRPPLRTA